MRPVPTVVFPARLWTQTETESVTTMQHSFAEQAQALWTQMETESVIITGRMAAEWAQAM